MKFQIIVTFVQSGDRVETEWTEAESEEFLDLTDTIKSNMGTLKYLEIGDNVIPGDLLRSSCMITFKSKD